MGSDNTKKLMDSETARAFVGDRFEKLRPRSTWPEWHMRCTVLNYTKDAEGRIVVSLAVTPKATNDAFSYFRVAVDRTSAETKVLEDRDLSGLNGPDFQGFDGVGA